MYKKILITTDGSTLSNTTALAGIALAQQLQAEVVALFVAPNYHYPMEFDVMPVVSPTKEEFRLAMEAQGMAHFTALQNAANEAGLRFSSVVAFADATAQQIVLTAKELDCDLIYIGSHGRGGWGQLLMGSVTNKVLSTCHVPVLVDRLQRTPS